MADEFSDDHIPLIAEQLHVDKESRITGRVQVTTQTETADTIIPIELNSTEVDVVRVPVDRKIDAVPDIAVEGDLTIVPVVEERVVITRELYLREELHIRRVQYQEKTEIPVSTRRQVAHVEHVPATDQPNPSTKEDHDDL